MFCPAGYVTLAELWKAFFAKHRVPLTRSVMEEYGQNKFELGERFGSPDDYCEDFFLWTLLGFPICAAAADGRLTHLETSSDEGRSSLFFKMSPFESFVVAGDPAQAGVDGYWLSRFGSQHFEPWDVTKKTLDDWKERFGGADGQVSERACFHSLPFAFERGRFVVPDAPPPWICDVIDEHYLPRMIAAFRGSALCMDDKTACKWRKEILNATELPQIGNLTWQKPARMGRPNKIEAIRKAYRRHYPDGRSVPWKEVIKVLEKETGTSCSMKTLRRAISMPVDSATKSPS